MNIINILLLLILLLILLNLNNTSLLNNTCKKHKKNWRIAFRKSSDKNMYVLSSTGDNYYGKLFGLSRRHMTGRYISGDYKYRDSSIMTLEDWKKSIIDAPRNNGVLQL